MKKDQNIFQKLIGLILEDISLLGIIGIISMLFGSITLLWTLLRILLSSLLGIKPIDDETGEYITMPWLGILAFLVLGILLIFIEKGYFYLKKRI